MFFNNISVQKQVEIMKHNAFILILLSVLVVLSGCTNESSTVVEKQSFSFSFRSPTHKTVAKQTFKAGEEIEFTVDADKEMMVGFCLLYTSPSPRDS